MESVSNQTPEARLAAALERGLGDALEVSGVHISKGIQRNREPDPLRILIHDGAAAERILAALPDDAALFTVDSLAARLEGVFDYNPEFPHDPPLILAAAIIQAAKEAERE